MTWYLWAFWSMAVGSFEEVIDKAVILKRQKKIDPLVATFYRNFAFFGLTALVGILGVFGKLSFAFNIHFLILAVLWPLNSLGYDYFLRNVEVSRFSGVLHIFPLIFLFADKLFFQISFPPVQVVGVFALVVGATLFSFNAQAKRSAFTLKGAFWMAMKVGVYAYLFVAFKMLGNSVNEVSFYFSIWLLVTAVYAVILLGTRKYKLLVKTASEGNFLPKTFLSKGFDLVSSIFYLEALSLASLTAVSAFMSFTPLVLLAVLFIASFFMKLDLAEDFSRKTLILKVAATALLVIGGLLFAYSL